MSEPQTVRDVYEQAMNEAKVKAVYYGAASAKQFEEGREYLSKFNMKRAAKWWQVWSEYEAVLHTFDRQWPIG